MIFTVDQVPWEGASVSLCGGDRGKKTPSSKINIPDTPSQSGFPRRANQDIDSIGTQFRTWRLWRVRYHSGRSGD